MMQISFSPLRHHPIPWLLGLFLLWTAALSEASVAAPSPGFAQAWVWQRVDAPVSGLLGAVAVDAAGQQLALGDEEGVSLRRLEAGALPVDGSGGWRRVSLPGAVVDVSFGPRGALWAGTLRGLYRIGPDGRREERSPAPGDAARRVHRVQIRGDLILVATDAGVFASADGRVWGRLSQGIPMAPVVAMATRAIRGGASGASRTELWLIAGERLYRLEVSIGDGSVEAAPARRVEIPAWPSSQSATDVVTGVGGDEVVVLFTQAIARTFAVDRDAGTARWEVVHPVLPPGASARRIVEIAGAVWLATDHGLLTSMGWPSRWSRTAQPAGSASTLALAGDHAALFAVGAAALWMGRLGPEVALASATRNGVTGRHADALAADPELRLVHAKALARAGLEPAYWRGLRARLRRRGWMPELILRAGAAYDRDTNKDYDESFSYGQLQRLNDRYSGLSRDFEGAVTLSWDLGDVVYNPEAPDLSREERQVITLRDTILDEINQLYFDRRRALTALARYADRGDPDAVALEIRARELAAGLDAWTGGWFSQQLDAGR